MTIEQNNLLKEFKKESQALVVNLYEVLENIDDDFSRVQELEGYGQVVDRIMGGVKIIALDFDPDHFIHQIANYSEICKTVAYKASQINDNEGLFCICSAFLMDATDVLKLMINSLGDAQNINLKTLFNHAFLDRLRWISSKFASNVRASVSMDVGDPEEAMDQNAIDELLKKLGM